MGSRQVPDRSNQKDRTRKALSDAAADLMRRGVQPTVADAAEAAGVHRATAYRYFPTAKTLIAEAALTAIDIDPEGMYAAAATTDPGTLLDIAVVEVCELILGQESLFRQNLVAALDHWFEIQRAIEPEEYPFRSIRRFRWIDPAIAPLAEVLDPAQFRRLRYALALSFGAEAVVVTRDVCRLEPDEATEVMRWAAQAILRSALAEAAGSVSEAGSARAGPEAT